MILVLDTNFLVDIFRFGIDMNELDSYQIATVESVMRELQALAKSKSSSGGYARLAMEWIGRKNVQILSSIKTKADDAIVDAARQDMVVGTNDSELRKRLKSNGVKTIYVRTRKHLELS